MIANSISANNSVYFGKYYPHNKETQEKLNEFYKENPKIHDNGAVDLSNVTYPAIHVSNAICSYNAVSNGDSIILGLCLLGSALLARMNLNDKQKVLQSATAFAQQLQEKATEPEEIRNALYEIASNNQHIPFGIITKRKINKIVDGIIQDNNNIK